MARIRLGILGGGQLAGMLLDAATPELGLDIAILDSQDAPTRARQHVRFVVGDITSEHDVLEFGKTCDAVTIEIEKVNTAALSALAALGVNVRPSAQALSIVQDKGLQKQFFLDNAIPSSPFILTENRARALAHRDFLPAVHKLRRGGYDGRGVTMLQTEADFAMAFDQPAVLEKKIDFEKEISVIVARGNTGEIAIYDPVEMVFNAKLNLLDYLVAPADLTESQQIAAKELAQKVAEKLQVVGLLAVEMFLARDGKFLVNEVAPRPHNSGHHTIEAAETSQFEQALRIAAGLPLGNTRAKGFALTRNILGREGDSGPAKIYGGKEAEKLPGVFVHAYGKSETRPGRKMGHITILGESRAAVEALNRSVNVYAGTQND